jgi:RNA polymerase sigma-70 factor (ECF subfamily)
VTNRLRADYARADQPYDVPDHREPPVGDPTDAALDRADMIAVLAALPVREREIVCLFYLADLSVDECAAICAVPVGTVKSRLSRARRMLRDELTRKGLRP